MIFGFFFIRCIHWKRKYLRFLEVIPLYTDAHAFCLQFLYSLPTRVITCKNRILPLKYVGIVNKFWSEYLQNGWHPECRYYIHTVYAIPWQCNTYNECWYYHLKSLPFQGLYDKNGTFYSSNPKLELCFLSGLFQDNIRTETYFTNNEIVCLLLETGMFIIKLHFCHSKGLYG